MDCSVSIDPCLLYFVLSLGPSDRGLDRGTPINGPLHYHGPRVNHESLQRFEDLTHHTRTKDIFGSFPAVTKNLTLPYVFSLPPTSSVELLLYPSTLLKPEVSGHSQTVQITLEVPSPVSSPPPSPPRQESPVTYGDNNDEQSGKDGIKDE